MIRDLSQLRAFIAIARIGSLGRAAESLHLTQSGLTRILQRLEEQVSAPLFERRASGMVLTAYGQAFEPYASLIVGEADNAIKELAALRGLEKGLIKVGAVGSALAGIVPEAVSCLLSQWPGLQVRVEEGLAQELAVSLAKGDIDLAVTFSMPTTEDISLVVESRPQEGCKVVASLDHPLRAKGNLKKEDLLTAKWVMPPRKLGPREDWQQWFLDSNLEAPPVTVETRAVDAMRSMVVQCGFLSWLPQLLIQSPAITSSLISPLVVESETYMRRFAVYRRRHGVLSSSTAKLLEELKKIVGAM
ncbi:LysR family transcriptional regulator [Herbaspirillum sp.]|uniref:LysR family transcriptional regulator n=1 Tax=Herbaspirillum sp. TaxID=1890675 RepID=UPI0031D5A208